MTQAQRQARPEAFISALKRMEARDDGPSRAGMAALRAGLRTKDGVALEMMPLVAEFLGEHEWPSDVWFFAVGALFALHPQEGGAGSLGAAFGRLRQQSDSIEKRFQLLLACQEEDLFGHLIQIVSLLKSSSIPLDWTRLLRDISRANWDERELQRRWARDFYQSGAGAASPSATDSSSD